MARKSVNPETIIDPVDALPPVTISGGVSAVLSEAVEFHRWSARMSRADVVKEAIGEWASGRDLINGARERLTEQLAAETDAT